MLSWAALFDFDGVLVDSAEYHEASWELLASEEGRILPPEHFKKGFGRKNSYIIPEILQWSEQAEEIERLSRKKEAIYRRLVQQRGIEPLPGVIEWLQCLKEKGVPCAIGSSTERKNLDCVLEVTRLADFFQVIISADDVTLGKPDPQVFLKGAEKLGVSPSCCVVFEDAHVGIEAALAGGMKVVAVATTHPAETLGAADAVVQRLDELSLEQVSLALFS